LVLWSLGWSFFSSCSPSFQIDKTLKEAVRENREAPDYKTWSLSEHHPERVFELLREQVKAGRDAHALSVELCQSFQAMPIGGLLLFETQIFDEENEEVLRFCIQSLKTKIQAYYDNNRAEFEAQGLKTMKESYSQNEDKRLPLKVIKRDLSQGNRYVDGDLPHKHVALTFDDGPNIHFTQMITKSLEDYGVRGHFFMIGRLVRQYPQLTKLVVGSGHVVGSHTYTHPCLGSKAQCGSKIRRVDYQKAVEEIKSSHQMIFDTVGFVDPIFRFPYGVSTPELQQFLKRNEITEFFWNLDSQDWKAHQSHLAVLNRTKSLLDRHQKGILLFHDIHRRTAEILPELLSYLARHDYTVVLITPEDDRTRINHPLLKK
jgi:peptidoglycan-N-acetylglucosamine deacetylase